MKLFWPQDISFEQALQSLQEQKPNELFAEDVLAFTQRLSKRLIRVRELPEIVALGYWLRKSNIKQMQHEFEEKIKGKIVRARGTTFHIAPSNVDTIFVYSWMLSLLAGNRNIIRISSKAEVNILLQIILEELPHFETVARQTIICTYGHDEDASYVISQACHTRVIWGGDETVKAIRAIPIAPLAHELAFPDRFSLALLNGAQVAELDDAALDAVLEKFYNDVFWFDQMACSSPRLVVWLGEKCERFWNSFDAKIKEKHYELLAATQVLKYTTGLMLAAEQEVKQIHQATPFTRIQLETMTPTIREQHCGGGLFYEYEAATIQDVADIVIDKDQTLAYFGFERTQLEELVEMIPSRGVDRIVPIGQALDFHGVWDGQSFLQSFTREITIL